MTESEKVNVEPTTPQAALLKEGAAIVRLENTVQMQIAIQRPRDQAKILTSALAMLDAYPAFAEKVHYLKPVGKDPDTGKMKYAEGLSIRAAESLQSVWDNSASGCEPVAEDDETVTLAGVFLDYERNIRHTFCKRVSKYYTTRERKRVMHPPDRFADVVMGANQSKLLRETILRSLPAELKMAYSDHAKEIMRRKPQAQRIKSMCDAFAVFGVKREQLEALKGKPLKQWVDDDIDEMQGIYNGLKDEETTVEQIFGPKEPVIEKANLQPKVSGQPALRHRRTKAEMEIARAVVKEAVATVADPELQKRAATQVEAMKTAPKPRDYCHYRKGIIDPAEQSANRAGEQECNACGYILIERP